MNYTWHAYIHLPLSRPRIAYLYATMEPLYRALARLTIATIVAMATSHMVGTLITQWVHWLLVATWTNVVVVAFWGLVGWITWGLHLAQYMLRMTYHILLRAVLFYGLFYLLAIAVGLPSVGEVAMDILRALGFPIDPDTLLEWYASAHSGMAWLGHLVSLAVAKN